MKLLLYCTKAKPYLLCEQYIDENRPCRILRKDIDKVIYNCVKENAINGKIIAECDFEVEGIDYNFYDYIDWFYSTKSLESDKLYKKACMQEEEMEKYLVPKLLMCSQNNVGYAIHIKNLHIFDKPKELEEVYKIDNVGGKLFTHSLKKAPQNMMHVSANRWVYDFYEPNDINILISIKPEWLCKILNGEKTIEVRRKVLKEMI